MTLTLHNKKRIAAFIEIATRDFNAARLLAQATLESAVFHLQQSVEKPVRALIEAETKVAGPTHNISVLADILTSDHPMHTQLKPLFELSLAATRYRYPTSGGTVFDFEGDVSLIITEVETARIAVVTYLKSHKFI
jgi:HEPN domain-containing protein